MGAKIPESLPSPGEGEKPPLPPLQEGESRGKKFTWDKDAKPIKSGRKSSASIKEDDRTLSSQGLPKLEQKTKKAWVSFKEEATLRKTYKGNESIERKISIVDESSFSASKHKNEISEDEIVDIEEIWREQISQDRFEGKMQRSRPQNVDPNRPSVSKITGQSTVKKNKETASKSTPSWQSRTDFLVHAEKQARDNLTQQGKEINDANLIQEMQKVTAREEIFSEADLKEIYAQIYLDRLYHRQSTLEQAGTTQKLSDTEMRDLVLERVQDEPVDIIISEVKTALNTTKGTEPSSSVEIIHHPEDNTFVFSYRQASRLELREYLKNKQNADNQ